MNKTKISSLIIDLKNKKEANKKMANKKVAQETTAKHDGLPISEESMKEHLKAFSDIEECIEALYKTEKKAYNKSNKPKRRNQV